MEGLKGRTAVFLLLLACWLLVLSNNGLAQTWQKVVPSGGSCSGSGSSKPTYLGVTSSSYDGAQVGGYTGANAKCVAQYGAGARMMTITDSRKLSALNNYPSDGWIDIRTDFSSPTTGELFINDYGPSSGNLNSNSCQGLTNTNSVYIYGFRISATGSVIRGSCSNPYPIHCVKD